MISCGENKMVGLGDLDYGTKSAAVKQEKEDSHCSSASSMLGPNDACALASAVEA